MKDNKQYNSLVLFICSSLAAKVAIIKKAKNPTVAAAFLKND